MTAIVASGALLRTEVDPNYRQRFQPCQPPLITTPSAVDAHGPRRPARLARLPRRPRLGGHGSARFDDRPDGGAGDSRATSAAPTPTLEWITAAYTLAMSVTLMLGSRLGDVLGRRRVLLVGIGGFVGASLLCALAPSPEALIAGAGAPGRGGRDHGPAGLRSDPRAVRRRGPAEGVRRVRSGDGPGRGRRPAGRRRLVNLDILGTGWRAIFLVNVPLGLVAIAAGRRFLPRTAPSAPGARLDAPSVALAMVGGVALVYPLIQGREHGWPAWSFALLAVGLVALGAFAELQARRSRQGRAPLVEPSILRRRSVRRRAGRRGRLHRGDGRHDDRAQRDVPDRPRVQSARMRARDRGDPDHRDRRVDHLIGAAGQDRPHDDAHRDRDDGDRPDRRRSRAALGAAA